MRPKVLLLDEPLGALDLKLRQAMQIELKEIQQEVGLTFIYVTHDQDEALTMSDRMAVFSHGRVEQVGYARRGVRATRLRGSWRGSSVSPTSLEGEAAIAITEGRRPSRCDPRRSPWWSPSAEVHPRRLHRNRTRPRSRIPRCRHPVHRVARRRRHACGAAAEPHHEFDGGAAGAGQGGAVGVARETATDRWRRPRARMDGSMDRGRNGIEGGFPSGSHCSA